MHIDVIKQLIRGINTEFCFFEYLYTNSMKGKYYMKHFFVTFFKRSNKPHKSPFALIEDIEAMAKEDVLPLLYQRLKITKEQFEMRYQVVEITEAPKKENE